MCVTRLRTYEPLQSSPSILKSYRRQKRCAPPRSPALPQCLQREDKRFQKCGLGSWHQRCWRQPCWGRAGSSQLPPEAAGASDTWPPSQELHGGGKALGSPSSGRTCHSDAWTWRACSGTTPERGANTKNLLGLQFCVHCVHPPEYFQSPGHPSSFPWMPNASCLGS
jgi:hypothetical protein